MFVLFIILQLFWFLFIIKIPFIEINLHDSLRVSSNCGLDLDLPFFSVRKLLYYPLDCLNFQFPRNLLLIRTMLTFRLFLSLPSFSYHSIYTPRSLSPFSVYYIPENLIRPQTHERKRVIHLHLR